MLKMVKLHIILCTLGLLFCQAGSLNKRRTKWYNRGSEYKEATTRTTPENPYSSDERRQGIYAPVYVDVFTATTTEEPYWLRVESAPCEIIPESEGIITLDVSEDYPMPVHHMRCWKVKVPENRFINISELDFGGEQVCESQILKIKTGDKEHVFCDENLFKNAIIELKDVSFYLKIANSPDNVFSVKYLIRDIKCLPEDSFSCSKFTCIPNNEVCDGVKNCEDGSDETECGVTRISGVSLARSKAIEWLKSKRTSSWGWQENTPRAVIALFLSNGAKFNGTNLEEELMSKQVELKTSIALYRNPLKKEVLSMFINALLVTCHNPKSFHGHNLVDRLKKQIKSSNFTHPMTYLTLCNANESWPRRALSDMKKILTGNSTYAFDRDFQAFAVIALSCYENRTEFFRKADNANLKTLYDQTILQFKEHQQEDGSFGNVHSTALVIQALISSGHEESKDWKLDLAIRFLMKELNSTHIDFIATYLVLPILNGKSLSDISKVNCNSNTRKKTQGRKGFFRIGGRLEHSSINYDNEILSEMQDYTGQMIRIQYSLYVGDEKDIIHTIFLRVPQNFTTFKVMKLAQVEDQKYNFEWKTVSEKIYVYKIANFINDPESGLFWLMYLGKMESSDTLKQSYLGPDDTILDNNDHLVMWYRTALY